MKNARTTSKTTTIATGIPTSMPVFGLCTWFVGCCEGVFEDVGDGVAKIDVDTITGLWLVDSIGLKVRVDDTTGL